MVRVSAFPVIARLDHVQITYLTPCLAGGVLFARRKKTAC
jgi:hypothetical protein